MSKDEEREFHDRYVSSDDVRSLESRFYSHQAETKENQLALDFIGGLHGKRLLFYGSGGHFSLIRRFAQQGASVVAIDISPETIAQLTRAIEREGFQGQCSAMVMDCESLTFEDESFDVVFARAIVHHLDTEISLQQIHRVLKPNGKLTVLEPLGTNPIINLYRWLTPDSRTIDEHPFVTRDIEMFKRYFPNTQIHYLYFLSIAAYFYRTIDSNERRFSKVFAGLCAVDRTFLSLMPPYRYLCWDVLFCSRKT